MNRRSSLTRKTPLQAKTSLKSNSSLKSQYSLSRKPMKKTRSKKALEKEFPQWVKDTVWERSGGMCERCKRRSLMVYHHCIFRSAGKACKPTLDNCLGLCIWCHTEDNDCAHKSRVTRIWCVQEAKRLAEVS